MMTMYQSLLMDTSVSTFLCTRNLGPEEVSLTSKRTETKLPKCSLKVLNDNFLMSETQQLIILTLYLLKIPTSSLYCFSAVYNSYWQFTFSLLTLDQARVLLRATPIN